MYNELSEVDIQKMREEIEHILKEVRPKCVEDLKVARRFKRKLRIQGGEAGAAALRQSFALFTPDD